MLDHKQDMSLSEKLWKECEQDLRKMCTYKLSSCPSEVDDVIAETYLSLCKAIDKGVDLENPRAWLYGTTKNLIKLKYTEINKRKKLFITYDSKEYELPYAYYCNEMPNEERLEKAKIIFDSLDESDKELLILHDVKGLTYKEIAKRIGSTEKAVKQKHYRLTNKIQKISNKVEKNFE